MVDSRRMWPILFGAGVGPTVPLTLIRRFNCDGLLQSQIAHNVDHTDQLEFLLLRVQRDVEALEVFAVPVALLLHLGDADLAICALCLQVADLFPQLFQLALESAYTLAQCVRSDVSLTLPTDRGLQFGLCTLCTRCKFGQCAAVFFGRMCLLTLEFREFGARILYLVLVCYDSVGKLLKFGVSLADVLVEAYHVIVGCLQLLPKRVGVRLEGASEIVSVLT